MVIARKLAGCGVAAALLICMATIAGAAQCTELLGDPVASGSMGRGNRIDPDTRYVNVEGGETIRFEIDGKIFG